MEGDEPQAGISAEYIIDRSSRNHRVKIRNLYPSLKQRIVWKSPRFPHYPFTTLRERNVAGGYLRRQENRLDKLRLCGYNRYSGCRAENRDDVAEVDEYEIRNGIKRGAVGAFFRQIIFYSGVVLCYFPGGRRTGCPILSGSEE